MIFFYISNEGVNLLENAGHLGLPIPQKVKEVLEQLHDRGEGSDGNHGTVYQALPWNHRGWHCGSGSKGSGNNMHIGVEITDLNIRKKPGTDQEKTGKYTDTGCFTIVAEDDGVGASKWGLLKAYEKERNGWSSLDFVTRI